MLRISSQSHNRYLSNCFLFTFSINISTGNATHQGWCRLVGFYSILVVWGGIKQVRIIDARPTKLVTRYDAKQCYIIGCLITNLIKAPPSRNATTNRAPRCYANQVKLLCEFNPFNKGAPRRVSVKVKCVFFCFVFFSQL